ncbi:hypothetical protein GWK47_003456 [Chionoecetes opilio]|uniref:Uncharacterized protein n=1 Tax=Chionoecetes opilio TaxID=41210 RepID=A0A8J4YRX9_CHIOP|nr:hypothetical protein GWK47_003456 [Chionoecetes opilio]
MASGSTLRETQAMLISRRQRPPEYSHPYHPLLGGGRYPLQTGHVHTWVEVNSVLNLHLLPSEPLQGIPPGNLAVFRRAPHLLDSQGPPPYMQLQVRALKGVTPLSRGFHLPPSYLSLLDKYRPSQRLNTSEGSAGPAPPLPSLQNLAAALTPLAGLWSFTRHQAAFPPLLLSNSPGSNNAHHTNAATGSSLCPFCRTETFCVPLPRYTRCGPMYSRHSFIYLSSYSRVL